MTHTGRFNLMMVIAGPDGHFSKSAVGNAAARRAVSLLESGALKPQRFLTSVRNFGERGLLEKEKFDRRLADYKFRFNINNQGSWPARNRLANKFFDGRQFDDALSAISRQQVGTLSGGPTRHVVRKVFGSGYGADNYDGTPRNAGERALNDMMKKTGPVLVQAPKSDFQNLLFTPNFAETSNTKRLQMLRQFGTEKVPRLNQSAGDLHDHPEFETVVTKERLNNARFRPREFVGAMPGEPGSASLGQLEQQFPNSIWRGGENPLESRSSLRWMQSGNRRPLYFSGLPAVANTYGPEKSQWLKPFKFDSRQFYKTRAGMAADNKFWFSPLNIPKGQS